jgi:hypothetical protein
MMRFEFCSSLIFHFKNLSSNSIRWHKMFQYSLSFLLLSSGTVCIIPLILFLPRYLNIICLLDPRLLACTPINLQHSINRTGRVSQFCCFDHVNGVALTQVQWNMNAGFNLFSQGNLFFICFSKMTLLSTRFATLTKMQQIYCTQFAEELVNIFRRITVRTFGMVGFRTG